MRAYANEQVIEEMKRLGIPYSHTTKNDAMKSLIVDHYNRSTQPNPLANSLRRNQFSTGLSVARLNTMYRTNIIELRLAFARNGVSSSIMLL